MRLSRIDRCRHWTATGTPTAVSGRGRHRKCEAVVLRRISNQIVEPNSSTQKLSNFDELLFSPGFWAAVVLVGGALWFWAGVTLRLPRGGQLLYSSFWSWSFGPWERWAATLVVLVIGVRYWMILRNLRKLGINASKVNSRGLPVTGLLPDLLVLPLAAVATILPAMALATVFEYVNVMRDTSVPFRVCQPVLSREQKSDCGRRSSSNCGKYKYLTIIRDWESPQQQIKLEGNRVNPVCLDVHGGRLGIPWAIL